MFYLPIVFNTSTDLSCFALIYTQSFLCIFVVHLTTFIAHLTNHGSSCDTEAKISWQEKTYSKDSDGRFCIIHFNSTVGESITTISQDSFNKLKETPAKRLILPDDEQKLLHISNSIPIELNLSQHGYHWRCYQLFTCLPKPSKRKLSSSIAVVDNELPSDSKRIRRSVVASTSVLVPANQ